MRRVIPERMETPRLLLFRAAPDDAEELFERYTADPEVSLYMPWSPHRSVEETRAFLRGRARAWEATDSYAWTVRWKDSGAMAGMVEATVTGHSATIGYVLARDIWGKGVGTEVASAVLEVLKELPPLHRIWAICDVDNVGSARLLEKLGLIREGRLHRWDRHNVSKEPRDCWSYAIWRLADGAWSQAEASTTS